MDVMLAQVSKEVLSAGVGALAVVCVVKESFARARWGLDVRRRNGGKNGGPKREPCGDKQSNRGNGALCRVHAERLAAVETNVKVLGDGQQRIESKLDQVNGRLMELKIEVCGRRGNQQGGP